MVNTLPDAHSEAHRIHEEVHAPTEPGKPAAVDKGHIESLKLHHHKRLAATVGSIAETLAIAKMVGKEKHAETIDSLIEMLRKSK